MMYEEKGHNKITSELIHTIPNRARFRVLGLKFLSKYKLELAKRFMAIKGIKSITVNATTQSILLIYDGKKYDLLDLQDLVDGIVGEYSLLALQEYKNSNKKDDGSKKEDIMSSGTIAKRLALNGLALLTGNTVLKREVSTVAQSFSCMQGLISLGLSANMTKSAVKGVIYEKRPNSDFLTVVSIIATLCLKNPNSALLILLMSDIAEWMTSYTVEKTRKSIKSMLSVDNTAVWCQLEDGSLEKRAIDQVKKGDTVVAHTGEKIAVDGIVEFGSALIDQSAITGEFVPVERRAGDSVFAGTVLKSGSIGICAEKVGDNTVVSRIVNMVESSETNKAPIQKYADKFSNYLVPLNFLLSVSVWLATKNAQKALKMLVIDYSCGVKLSTATAFSAAINNAVKHGVLIKGGTYIEQMSKANTILLDKTGTVTKGKPKVVSMKVFDATMDEKEVLKYALAAEETSTHPLAGAIMDYGYQMDVEVPVHGETITYVARGTETNVDGHIVRVGSAKYMQEFGADMSNIVIDDFDGAIANYISIDDKVVGVLYAMDQLRNNIRRAVNTLRYDGVCDIELLTGDMEPQAKQVASMIGADGYKAQMMPEQKAQEVLKLQNEGHSVVMVGDGINDAPALAYADVGISMGSKSTDIAIETSDVVIGRDDPMMIAELRRLSVRAMDIVHQNFALVIGINSVGLILGAASNISVMFSSILHNTSTIMVVGNSLRLLFAGSKE